MTSSHHHGYNTFNVLLNGSNYSVKFSQITK
jgi:hypothetical protein